MRPSHSPSAGSAKYHSFLLSIGPRLNPHRRVVIEAITYIAEKPCEITNIDSFATLFFGSIFVVRRFSNFMELHRTSTMSRLRRVR